MTAAFSPLPPFTLLQAEDALQRQKLLEKNNGFCGTLRNYRWLWIVYIIQVFASSNGLRCAGRLPLVGKTTGNLS